MCYDEFGPKWTEIDCSSLCTTSEHAPQVERKYWYCMQNNQRESIGDQLPMEGPIEVKDNFIIFIICSSHNCLSGPVCVKHRLIIVNVGKDPTSPILLQVLLYRGTTTLHVIPYTLCLLYVMSRSLCCWHVEGGVHPRTCGWRVSC